MIGAARSGFFGAQWSAGVGTGNGFLALDLAGHRLISAAAIGWRGERASRFGDPGMRHPVLQLCAAQNKLEQKSLRYL